MLLTILFIRNDIDVNDHETIKFYTWTQIIVMEQHIYCSSFCTFQSQLSFQK